MAFKIKIPVAKPEDGIMLGFEKKFTINRNNAIHFREVEIKARRNMAGDIILYEHPEVDIVVNPKKTKVSILPKGRVSDDSYDIQDRFFKYLIKFGLVDPVSIQSSSAYGILEGTYYTNEEVPTLGLLLFFLNEYITKDKENYVYDEIFDKMEKEMTEPEEDRTTELGEIPHEEMQGALRPGYVYPYGTYGAMGLYRI